jgi:two-component system capsular synthesis response regulator RcsB
MFKKILVAEDIDSISLGMELLFKNNNFTNVTYTKYCDDALLKIKKAAIDNEPFDLLITDLSFKESHRDEKIASGESLLEAVKKEQPDIKTIAYSIEERGYTIRYLLDGLDVDGYVSKGRDSTNDLLKAITDIYNGKKYISMHLAHLKKPVIVEEMDDMDLEIITLLGKGHLQNEIVESFKTAGRKLASISSIEKRIIKMKTSLRARNTTHLVSIAKDMGII